MIIAETIEQARNAVAQARNVRPHAHKTASQAQGTMSQARNVGFTVGLVPTMGALHEGHLTLIRRCRTDCDCTVVSIFVNPVQFGTGEDLESYPRSIEADLDVCRTLGVDLVFTPSARQMYPGENLTWIDVDRITDHLCGESRPAHFRGVCTVVAKLFNIIMPDIAYFGQKDAQQLAVIRRMVADLNMPIDIRPCPTVREPDGLAMSSRNRYLAPGQRRQALCLRRALLCAEELIGAGQTDPAAITAAMQQIVDEQSDAQIDYISIVDNELLQLVTCIDSQVLIALAVRIGPARLIDNIVVDPPAAKA